MKFWDSSAVVPLVIDEKNTQQVRAVFDVASEMFAWWGTEVECVSAISRLERENTPRPDEFRQAISTLNAFQAYCNEVKPMTLVRDCARRLLRRHPLRAADSLRLAAAPAAADYQPERLDFVCNDKRLCIAAQKEGFNLIIPT